MINSAKGHEKIANDYLEKIREKIGHGFSDKATTKKAKKELGKNDFIKLMSVQLQYQDPISPLKNEEMAAQLAQFSGLEQLTNLNSSMDKMIESNTARDNLMASSLIGKNVVTDTSGFKLDDDRNVTIEFQLAEKIAKGTLSIVNSSGEIVREVSLDPMQKGKATMSWNGQNAAGAEVKLGDYRFRVTAYDEHGKKVEATTQTNGLISGIEFDKGVPVLLVGSHRVQLSDVKKIIDSANSAVNKALSTMTDPSEKLKGSAVSLGNPAIKTDVGKALEKAAVSQAPVPKESVAKALPKQVAPTPKGGVTPGEKVGLAGEKSKESFNSAIEDSMEPLSPSVEELTMWNPNLDIN